MLGLDFGILDLDLLKYPHRRSRRRITSVVSREKAGAGLLRLSGQPTAVVLGADTEVVLDGRIFGKPVDADDAAAMLRSLSGRKHAVISALSMVSAARESHAVSVSEVTFATLSEDDIRSYLGTGEWDGKAGAYAIQGMAQSFISHLSGSHSGVMGLPLRETSMLLKQFGLFPVAHPATEPSQAPVAMESMR